MTLTCTMCNKVQRHRWPLVAKARYRCVNCGREGKHIGGFLYPLAFCESPVDYGVDVGRRVVNGAAELLDEWRLLCATTCGSRRSAVRRVAAAMMLRSAT